MQVPCLFEEEFVFDCLTYSQVAPLVFAEFQDRSEKRISGIFEFFDEAGSSGQHSDFDVFVDAKYLVETYFVMGVFCEIFPFFDNVHQIDFTLDYVASRV
jgi:hypothetical protein